jgi:hypothetical protein
MTIYSLVADPEWAEILTLLFIGLVSLAWLSFIWGNAKRQNQRLTTFDWGGIYVLGFLAFFCGGIILGKFIVPKNADSLLEILGIDYVLEFVTRHFQAFLLAIIRPMV